MIASLFCSLLCFIAHASYAQTHRIFNELPRIETPHLILRSCEESDAHDLFGVQGDPEVVKFTPMECDENAERTLYWIRWRLERQSRNEPAPWVIEHKADKKVIGLCGFYTFDEQNATANLLITFNRKYDKSLEYEAVDAACECGFTAMGLNRINMLVHPDKTDAITFCEECEKRGLRKIGVIPECLWYKGAFWDRVLYCVLRKDWPRRAKLR